MRKNRGASLLDSNAVIFGLEGKALSDKEKSFYKRSRPVGFILFSRNIENPEQVKSLTMELRDTVGWHCPILIDQEGGRVARLKPPYWKKHPSMDKFARLALSDLEEAKNQTYKNAESIASELVEIGVNVDCAPVVDLKYDGAHDIIGDRSFGSDPEIVAQLSRKTAEGLLAKGVLPIIKHIPGHGRAKADSHKELPIVNASLKELLKTDFKPFSLLADMPWAMTAHILYKAIDPNNPATLSSRVINFIRKEIGFRGILISDDLSMEALTGSFAQRAIRTLEAGCDIILHCNGGMHEMTEIASVTPKISNNIKEKLEEHFRMIS